MEETTQSTTSNGMSCTTVTYQGNYIPNKALIITPFFYPNVGGAETFAEDLAKSIAKKYIVHICTIKWTKPVLWEGMNFFASLQMAWKLYFPLIKMTRKYKYDKIYALGLIPSFLCALLNLRFSSVILALYDFKKPSWFRTFLNKANKVFVEGVRGKNDMLNAGVKPSKIVMFQHWCDQTKFNYVPKNNETMKVLFVGRPIWIKGKHVIQQCEKITKGIEYEYIESVPYKDLPKYYQNADVVVVPSLYSEGFSRVVIEAASCGCALLTSNKGALPELVAPFGKCLEPYPENFAEMLMKVKRYPEALEKIQIKTVTYALENFNEKNADIFLL